MYTSYVVLLFTSSRIDIALFLYLYMYFYCFCGE